MSATDILGLLLLDRHYLLSNIQDGGQWSKVVITIFCNCYRRKSRTGLYCKQYTYGLDLQWTTTATVK